MRVPCHYTWRLCFATVLLVLPTSEILFARTDDGAGGALQTFKRRLKFGLRYAWFKPQIQHVFDTLTRLGLSHALDSDPQLMLRCTRAYAWTGLKGKTRAAAEVAHFEWLVHTLTQPIVSELYLAHQMLVAEWTVKERVVRIWLRPGRALGREGELELHLALDDGTVMRAAFSVLPHHMLGFAHAGSVMVVGNVQGSQEGKDLVKDFTTLMERTRPSGVLINALQGLAQGWGLVGLVGVSDQGHAYSDYGSLSKRVGISYDSLWAELGAERRVSTQHWDLPLTWEPRPESEVESKKRSQLRKRNELRLRVLDASRVFAQKKSPSLATRG